MSLDLSRLTAQVSAMVGRLRDTRVERDTRLRLALDTLRQQAGAWTELQTRIDGARTTWLVPGLVSGLNGHYAPPPRPDNFSVLATDGSQIEVDRHRYPRCYLINIGSVALHYGAAPGATLTNHPELCFAESDMVIAPPHGRGREQVIDAALLGLKRGLAEWGGLLTMARDLPPGGDALALVDGTLVLWGLEAYPEFVSDVMLKSGYLVYLDEMRALNAGARLAVASYISLPRATEVVAALRVAFCPFNPPDCDRHCPNSGDLKCDGVAGVIDREIFDELLGDGERSDVFASRSRVVLKHYGEQRIYFYYVNVGNEIGRVEVPRWVAEDESLLALSHALLLDQCRRGHGYPVALAEAHEQAVVSGGDRENFWRLVEITLARARVPGRTSAKAQRKQSRWV